MIAASRSLMAGDIPGMLQGLATHAEIEAMMPG
jgi:hypothetical protein